MVSAGKAFFSWKLKSNQMQDGYEAMCRDVPKRESFTGDSRSNILFWRASTMLNHHNHIWGLQGKNLPFEYQRELLKRNEGAFLPWTIFVFDFLTTALYLTNYTREEAVWHLYLRWKTSNEFKKWFKNFWTHHWLLIRTSIDGVYHWYPCWLVQVGHSHPISYMDDSTHWKRDQYSGIVCRNQTKKEKELNFGLWF